MKAVLISPIGLAPAVVTEVLYSIGEVEDITDICIIATKNKDVQAGAWLVKAAIDVDYREMTGKRVRTHIHTMDLEDVSSREEATEFVNVLVNVVEKEREKYGVRKILLNLAGARKVESAIMLMMGMIWRVPAVYHVVHKHIGGYSPELERVRHEIRGILDAEDKTEYYMEKRDLFHDVLFPDPHDYEVFEVPFIPFSIQEINALKELIRGIDISDSIWSEHEIKVYRRMGLITLSGTRTAPTELGKVFLKVLELV